MNGKTGLNSIRYSYGVSEIKEKKRPAPSRWEWQNVYVDWSFRIKHINLSKRVWDNWKRNYKRMQCKMRHINWNLHFFFALFIFRFCMHASFRENENNSLKSGIIPKKKNKKMCSCNSHWKHSFGDGCFFFLLSHPFVVRNGFGLRVIFFSLSHRLLLLTIFEAIA